MRYLVTILCLALTELPLRSQGQDVENAVVITTDKGNEVTGTITDSQHGLVTIRLFSGEELAIDQNRIVDVSEATEDNYEYHCWLLKQDAGGIRSRVYRIEVADNVIKLVRFSACNGGVLQAKDLDSNVYLISEEEFEGRAVIPPALVPLDGMRPEYSRLDPGAIMYFVIPTGAMLNEGEVFFKTTILFLPGLLAVGLNDDLMAGYQLMFPAENDKTFMAVQSLFARYRPLTGRYFDAVINTRWLSTPIGYQNMVEGMLIGEYHSPRTPIRLSFGAGLTKSMAGYTAMPVYTGGFQFQTADFFSFFLAITAGRKYGLGHFDLGMRFFGNRFLFECGLSVSVFRDPVRKKGYIPWFSTGVGFGYRF